MQRYFATVINDIPHILDEDMHHILHVMRMKMGDRFEVVDDGYVYEYQIDNVSPFNVSLIEKRCEEVELNKQVTLFFALAKGDKIDLVIQKCTELGVHRVILFKSKRCVVNYDNKDTAKKISRYQKIAKEASEQCHRLVIPEILGVIDLNDIDKYLSDINLLAYEKESGLTTNSFNLDDNSKSVSIMIGPEGGFDEKEVTMLVNKGFKTISLGKRILRCETAAIYALSVLSYLLEK